MVFSVVIEVVCQPQRKACSTKEMSECVVGQAERGAHKIVDDCQVVLHNFGVGGRGC